jgi:CHRD domain
MKQKALLLTLALLALSTSPVQAKRSPVGYVGCSISTQIVRGYSVAGGGDFWRPRSVFDGNGTLGTYPGGALVLWAMALTDDLNGLLSYWKDFDAMNRARPGASKIWLQVCVAKPETVAETVDAGVRVMAEIARRLPRAVVYASVMPDYAVRPPQFDIDAAVTATQQLVDRGLVRPGPTMPRVTEEMLMGDTAHINAAGELRFGRELLDFFGRSVTPVGFRAKGAMTGTLRSRKLYYTLGFSQLSAKATAAYLHRGRRGVNGPRVARLCGPCRSLKTGAVVLTSSQVKELVAGRMYVTVATAENPRGEVRAQIERWSGSR